MIGGEKLAYFDYYEALILTCSFPGCGWTVEADWDGFVQQGGGGLSVNTHIFLKHFDAAHSAP